MRLLEREGIAIHFPAAQTCCGQPAYTSGYPDEARAVAGFARPDGGAPCTIALHTSCHARRDMSVHETGAALLAGLGQVTVAQQARPEECCGFGGAFSLRHPAISEAIVTDKVDSLKASGAQAVVSADCGCLFNILGRAEYLDRAAGRRQASLPGEHIASFLWRRTRGTA